MRWRSRRANPAQLSLFDPLFGPRPRRATHLAPWTDGDLLCFDLETTGIDPARDVPVSFALVTLRGRFIRQRSVRIVNPGRPVPLEATAVHGITTDRTRWMGMPLDEAVDTVTDALLGASRNGVPVVGIKLDYDLTIIDVLCRRRDGRGLIERGWTGPALDVLVLDRHVDPFRRGRRTLVDLCSFYGVQIEGPHQAECDAEAAGQVLLAMAHRHDAIAATPLHELHAAQVEYHQIWATSYDAWRRSQGRRGLGPNEWSWPIVRRKGTDASVA